MSTSKEKSPPPNLQFVCDKEVSNLLERLIDSVVVEVTANRSTLQPQQVSIGRVETKADWRYIVELEETIDKMNVELSQSHTKICELDVKVREQEKVLSSAQEEMTNLREENARLARDLKEMMASNDGALNINSLPDEMLINIFSHLLHNELGQIARVCRRWNVLTKNPVLWKEVNVKFDKNYKSQNAVTRCFVKMLPPCVTRIRLDFKCFRLWTEQLNFQEFCVELQRCPRLEMLMLKDAALTDSLLMVIDLCCQFLQNLKILILNRSTFRGHPEKREICGTSKIEVLDLSRSWLGHFNTFPFFKMPHLEQLRLSNTTVGDSWFEDTSFLKQLHVLDVGNTYIGFRTFQAIRNHGLNLKQLYICETKLRDTDLNFNNSAFPQLETICLLRCDYVTCEGVVSLIQTCQSLQNVYVHKDVAVTYAAHPFIVANTCKLEIVKYIPDCDEHRRDNY